MCWGHYYRKRRNSPLESPIREQKTCNIHYFDNINTSNKAYLLGLILTDGCIYKSRNSLCFSFGSKDLELVEFVKQELKSTHNIGYRKFKNFYILEIFNTYLCESLAKYNIIPRKSLIVTYPNHLNGYDKDFIRGCLDGDGSIVYEKSKYWNSSRLRFQWIGTFDLLHNIEKHLKQNLDLKKQKIHKYSSIYRLIYSSKQDNQRIYDYLYDSNGFYLKRKKDIFNDHS